MLRVNGSTPRKKDYENCTTPEQQDSEEQPLSLLLPGQRAKYAFTHSGRDVVDRRDAIVISYREIRKPTVDVSLVEDNEDCVSFDIEGGMRGRIWIDAETHDVLRIDRSLSGLIEIPLPRKVTRRAGRQPVLDDGAVGFVDSLPPRHVRGPAGNAGAADRVVATADHPRRRHACRTSTQYLSYRRFITGARVVPRSDL